MAETVKKKKNIAKGQLVGGIMLLALGGLLVVAAVVLGALGFVLDGADFLIGAVICLVFGCFCIPFGAVAMSRYVKISRNLKNPDSLCAQTYGGKEYIYLPVYLDREEQKERNSWANLIGILTLIGLGRGFFSYGASTSDAFISKDEIIINKYSNRNFDDKGFLRYSAKKIKQILIGGIERYTKITIVPDEGASVILEVPVSKKLNYEQIQQIFSLLLPDEEAEA